MSPWVKFIVTLFLGFLGVHKFMEKKIGAGFLYLFTVGLLCVGWFYDIVISLRDAIKGVPEDTADEEKKSVPDQVKELTVLPVINTKNIILKDDEYCHYFGPAKSVITKNKVVKYSGGSAGVGVHVAKGINLRVGKSKATPIRENVTTTHSGNLYITSKRIILSVNKGGFDKKISNMTSITPYSDGFQFQFGSQVFTIMTNDVVYIAQIIQGIINDMPIDL